MTPHPARFPAITFAAIAAELARELALRGPFYQRQVERCRMTRHQANTGLDVVAAWQEDCARMQAAFAPLAQGRPAALPPPPRHTLTWRSRHAALLAELAQRAEIYPREIERRRLTPADAAHRTACLQALLAFYDDGLDWPADPATRAALHTEIAARLQPATVNLELALA